MEENDGDNPSYGGKGQCIPIGIRLLIFVLFYLGRRWLDTNRPFGWEVVELRYGGLLIRLASLKERLISFLEDNKMEQVDFPEIQTELFRIHEKSDHLPVLGYSRAATPSRNLGTG